MRFVPYFFLMTAAFSAFSFAYGERSERASWWQPHGRPTWQIQFSGDMSFDVQAEIFDVDMEETTATQIALLHRRGAKVVCYISAGSVEDWRSDARSFPSSLVGKEMDGWAGERWVDVRQVEALRKIMGRRMDQAKSKGCDAIDPDNLDGYQTDTGFPIHLSDNIRYSLMLAEEAHRRGLAIGLKNGLEQIASVVHEFDFSINEQCFQYDECHRLKPFIGSGKPVLNIEYEGNRDSICAKSKTMGFRTLFKRLSLDSYRHACP